MQSTFEDAFGVVKLLAKDFEANKDYFSSHQQTGTSNKLALIC
jgi:hypothetical protein